MKISQNGIDMMHHFEGCKLRAYPDPGSRDGNPWTIGWGHTGTEVISGLVWTQAKADSTFVEDLYRFEQGVFSLVKVPLTQGQFDALVSFSYNVGLGNLGDSTLLRKLNARDYAGAAMEFRKWNKNGGKVMRGLTRRRGAEEALFNGLNGQQAIAQGELAT